MSAPKCTCINDKKRPPQISPEKWIKEGEEYRILGLYVHVKQGNIQGITLIEKPLDETCRPYQTFAISRFKFKDEDMPALLQLAKDCNDLRDMEDAEIERLLHEVEADEEMEVLR